ncbi:MAG: hypothetical protein WAK16_00735 [Candidatus Cybelea sp.]
MKASSVFALVVAIGVAILVTSGCGSVGPAPVGAGVNAPPPATPPAKWLYVHHNGEFFSYRLPLSAASKPVVAATEWPGSAFPPVITVGPYGNVALANATEIRILNPPIVSFDRSRIKLTIKLTPAITNVGPYGAELEDIEYDPNGNLWLFNNLGPSITELRAPLTKNMVASLSIPWGAPGSKTSGYTALGPARFDVNAALYLYATNGNDRSRLFKVSFPYAKPASSLGINLDQPDFVDSTQYLPTSKNPASVILGQYIGQLRTPKPGSPPSPPADVLGQFNEPLMPVNGLIPNDHTSTVVDALVADPPRELFYTLGQTGRINAYTLPLSGGAKPVLNLPCLAGTTDCTATGFQKLELAP